ncbi:MAG: bifunctional phosphopantothenoylcysteine decarboxylase/phosphopantothenate--cysteine ligase CoaBC [Xanthomonadaceae bacterium]|jgi:phosphopantothenoylcysteine decarboxylase/phosphopantothenate--cysteine ligase|nr:bifunctional phosphopantothenoylcysteine decarboxylase/phosphopantothenate--cysteine ligase CoaBC [Xanthomonadaceae bacterium]
MAYVGTLEGTRVLLGVSGGIAAYKAADLVRRLRDAGAEVRVVMTAGARQFVTPATFQALSGHPVRSDLWDPAAEAAMGHIELARWAEIVLVAPASANTLARLAHGLADDLLSTLCLATSAPLMVAPAMNQQMWAHPATQANVATLGARGVVLLGPDSGGQACGEFGAGRLVEPPAIVERLAALRAPGVLAGRVVVVSAGPTFEDVDPVRFIGNRSSGRMGFAIAAAAAAAGAEVRLVAGPVHLPTPARVARRDVRSAREMHAAVLAAVAGADAYVGAAAVADFRPAVAAPDKIKKTDGAPAPTLLLERTEDILAAVAALPARPFCVGFAAETGDVEAYARGKLQRKRVDLVCANRVGAPGEGFDADDNALLVLGPDGFRLDLGRAPKAVLATRLVELIAQRLPAPRAAGARA